MKASGTCKDAKNVPIRSKMDFDTLFSINVTDNSFRLYNGFILSLKLSQLCLGILLELPDKVKGLAPPAASVPVSTSRNLPSIVAIKKESSRTRYFSMLYQLASKQQPMEKSSIYSTLVNVFLHLIICILQIYSRYSTELY